MPTLLNIGQETQFHLFVILAYENALQSEDMQETLRPNDWRHALLARRRDDHFAGALRGTVRPLGKVAS
jgi:hypothetical protein